MKKMTLFVFAPIVVALILLLTPQTREKNEKLYFNKFNEYKNDFMYFSNYNNTIRNQFRSCDYWYAENTLKGRFSFSCKINIYDSLHAYEPEFVDSADIDRMRKFMVNAEIQDIMFYKDSVKFIFIDGVSMITKQKISLPVTSLDSLFTLRW